MAEPLDTADRQPADRPFQVRVGHWQLAVKGRTRDDVIATARRQLCRDFPRLWDVIFKLADERFCVEEFTIRPASAS